MHEPLELWTVYFDPADFPGLFVARKWLASALGERATEEYLKADTLEGVRALLPRGLHMLPRSRGDDPVIVETWF